MKHLDLFATSLAILLLGLFVSGCSSAPKEDVLRTYGQAQESFEQAQSLPSGEQREAFRRVALIYQGLIDQGVRSGPVYYNLGNAWARSEEPGRAIAAYRLALRYMPLEPHLASNLQTVLGGTVPPEPPAPLIEYLFFWQNWVGQRQKAVTALVLSALTFLVATVRLFVPRRFFKNAALSLLALSLVAIASTGYDWYRYEMVSRAVVAMEGASPRKGNSDRYELSFTDPLPLGTTGRVLDERGGWVHLQFAPDKDGWLPEEQVVRY